MIWRKSGFILPIDLLCAGEAVVGGTGLKKPVGFVRDKTARRAYLNEKFGRTGDLHANINARQQAYYDRLAYQHINGSDKTVLGIYRANVTYAQKAKNMKANYFDIGKEWYKIPKSQRWVLNEKFLQRVTEMGNQIHFNVPKTHIRPSNIYSIKEIKYLENKAGYKWINQWSLKKR